MGWQDGLSHCVSALHPVCRVHFYIRASACTAAKSGGWIFLFIKKKVTGSFRVHKFCGGRAGQRLRASAD